MALPDALTALKTYMQSQNPEKLTKILDKKMPYDIVPFISMI